MTPQSLQYNCLQIWHLLQVLLFDHCAVDVVSVPPVRNSEHKHTISFMLSFLLVSTFPSFTGSWRSNRDAEASNAEEAAPMDGLDVLDLGLVQLVAEAHEDQQGEHGILEVVHDLNTSCSSISSRIAVEAIEEELEDPAAGAGEGLDAGRVEDLGGEVAAEETPGGAVGGGADVVLVAGGDAVGGEGGGTGGEDGAVLDQGLVGERVVGDENGGAVEDAEGDDGAVLGVEVAKDGLHLNGGFAEQGDAADERESVRSRRKLFQRT
ncbi:hypothetical protein TIFTF001_013336 [Ficus carica]|uniref:Uncharacterized protein n=1 Tax=Ficus carica TaxID=3494 RepID=A0AA88D2S9_FICCA|nr:hypothetical protein TIFTF001_013336 [Ficus carica]